MILWRVLALHATLRRYTQRTGHHCTMRSIKYNSAKHAQPASVSHPVTLCCKTHATPCACHGICTGCKHSQRSCEDVNHNVMVSTLYARLTQAMAPRVGPASYSRLSTYDSCGFARAEQKQRAAPRVRRAEQHMSTESKQMRRRLESLSQLPLRGQTSDQKCCVIWLKLRAGC